MRIGKPILLVTTPLGLAIGLIAGYHLAGGLVVLMAVMITLFGVGILAIVRAVRHEAIEGRKRAGDP